MQNSSLLHKQQRIILLNDTTIVPIDNRLNLTSSHCAPRQAHYAQGQRTLENLTSIVVVVAIHRIARFFRTNRSSILDSPNIPWKSTLPCEPTHINKTFDFKMRKIAMCKRRPAADRGARTGAWWQRPTTLSQQKAFYYG